MSIVNLLSNTLLLIGAAFFLAGTIGMLRFPDVYTRLHALAKVDNLGLGFTTLGLLARTDTLGNAVKLILVWLLTLVASAAVSFLIARRARRRSIDFWRAKERT